MPREKSDGSGPRVISQPAVAVTSRPADADRFVAANANRPRGLSRMLAEVPLERCPPISPKFWRSPSRKKRSDEEKTATATASGKVMMAASGITEVPG